MSYSFTLVGTSRDTLREKVAKAVDGTCSTSPAHEADLRQVQKTIDNHLDKLVAKPGQVYVVAAAGTTLLHNYSDPMEGYASIGGDLQVFVSSSPPTEHGI